MGKGCIMATVFTRLYRSLVKRRSERLILFLVLASLSRLFLFICRLLLRGGTTFQIQPFLRSIGWIWGLRPTKVVSSTKKKVVQPWAHKELSFPTVVFHFLVDEVDGVRKEKERLIAG